MVDPREQQGADVPGSSTPPSLTDAVQAARSGDLDFRGLLGTFVVAPVVVPSGAALDDGRGAFEPVTYAVGAVTYVAVFTTLERASSLGDMAPYATTMTGLDVLRRVRPGGGVVIDPGSADGFQIDPEVVESIVASAPRSS